MAKPAGESVPKQMQPIFDAVVALTDAFCKEHLTEEYVELCRKLTAALCRKRPSPLSYGNLYTWACAIVYAIGANNFLFDKSQTPYMNAADLAAAFGLAKRTAGNKAKAIRDIMKMKPLDWHWALPSKLDHYPFAWLVEYNGLVVNARHLPREVQEIAFAKGMIPYVPAAKKTDKTE